MFSVEGTEQKQTACYDIDVEVDDTLKTQMNNFLLSTASQQEIQSLDNKIHETVDTINQLKTNREFFLSFAKDPQQFINKWIISQTRDLKVSDFCSSVWLALWRTVETTKHKFCFFFFFQDYDGCGRKSRGRTSK